MRYGLLFSLILAVRLFAVPPAVDPEVALKCRPESDEIHWKDPARGAPLKVRILEVTADSVILEKQLATGLTRRTVSHNELSDVKFSFSPWEVSLHRESGTASLTGLRILWERRKSALKFPGSGVSETAVALAKALRLTATNEAFDEAEAVLNAALENTAGESQRILLTGERHSVLLSRSIHQEKYEEADRLAWEITEQASEAYSDAMLLATGFLADRHFSQLRAVEAEHPRWTEDDEVKPVRDRLYHLSLDFALYPSLFHGRREIEASTGLRKAAEVYQFTGETGLLKNVLQDLAALYPDSEAAKEMEPLLAKILASEKTGESPEVETSIAEEKSEEEPVPTQVPPPPKNYNLFSD